MSQDDSTTENDVPFTTELVGAWYPATSEEPLDAVAVRVHRTLLTARQNDVLPRSLGFDITADQTGTHPTLKINLYILDEDPDCARSALFSVFELVSGYNQVAPTSPEAPRFFQQIAVFEAPDSTPSMTLVGAMLGQHAYDTDFDTILPPLKPPFPAVLAG